jgi:hypothetical protein
VVVISFMGSLLLLRPNAPAANDGGALDPECGKAKRLAAGGLNSV